jgi:hypothetical protein
MIAVEEFSGVEMGSDPLAVVSDVGSTDPLEPFIYL